MSNKQGIDSPSAETIVPTSEAGDMDLVSKAQKLVDDLYELRDRFYDTHELSCDRKSAVLERQTEVLRSLMEMNFPPKDKCYQLLCLGRTHNVMDDYSAEAEAHLTKAIKLNPKLAEAWCELGECHWKRGDVTKAYNALQSALDYKVDKRALRSLSMVLRSLPTSTPEERAQNIQQSWKKAREALNLDVKDGLSWLNMANSLISIFFVGNQRHRATGQAQASHMSKALSAFEQASRDPVAWADSSLHFNWGVALCFEDEFARALQKFQLANQLDPAWEKPREYSKDLIGFIRRCQTLINQKGQMKAKRFNNLVQQLATREEKELGPYSGSNSGGTNKVALECVPFNQLKVGANIGKVVVGRMVCNIGTCCNTSFTILLVDKDGTVMPVSLFCIGAGQGPMLEDSIAIPDPFVENVDMEIPASDNSTSQEKVEFHLIRVPTTEILVVNGKRINSKWAARPVLDTQILT